MDWSLDDAALEFVLLPTYDEGEPNEGSAGTPLKLIEPLHTVGSSEELAANQLRIALPSPQLGKFTVAVRYKYPRAEDVESNEWGLPLLRPVDAVVTDWDAMVLGPRNFDVALNTKSTPTSWKPGELSGEDADVRSAFNFSAAVVENLLPLLLSPVERSPTTATTIDRVWLQSWIAGNVRQDRAAFRFRTSASQAMVELPPRAPAEEVEVILDGQPAENLSQATGRIAVRIESDRREGNAERHSDRAHTLELRWREPINEALLTRHQLTPPQLLGAKSLSQVYWQIVLPGDVHIIRSPSRMAPSGEWQWLGSFWGRRPRMQQVDLETWAEASHQMAPTNEHNQYLYTAISPAVSIELVSGPRWLIVLAASSVVLAAGLIWIYVPASRSRWVVAGLACVLAALAVAYPVPAIFLAQASVLGVVVALLAMVLTRLTARPALVPISVSTGSSRYSPPRGDSVLMPPVVATASTAPTVPLRVQEGER
jgi:hypothetical protein